MNKKWLYALFIFVILLNALILFTYNKNAALSALASIGRVLVDISIPFIILINSPENRTYHFENWQNLTIDLNVSANMDVDVWTYTLVKLSDNSVVYNNVAFTPNITINVVRKSNRISVTALRNSTELSTSVVFYVDVNNSAPLIQTISSPVLVCENNYLSYFFNTTDIDEDSLTLSLSPINPFYVAKVVQTGNITRGEIFSGTLAKNKKGSYAETVYAADNEYTDSRQFNITVIEINNRPSVSSIGAQTVWTNETFYYQTNAADVEDGNSSNGNLKFNLSFFSGNRLFNISYRYGIINFTANASQVGVYNLSICVEDNGITEKHQNISFCGQDGNNLTKCINWSLTVTASNREPNITSWFPLNLSQTINQSESVYFNISKYDPDGTIPDSYWYVNNILVNSFRDNITYTFSTAGIFNFTAEITDGLLNDSVSWNITVNAVPSAVSAGGGGGGGASIMVCVEKWGCRDWNDCQNLDFLYKKNLVDKSTKEKIDSNCKLAFLNSDNCGYQIRECSDTNKCNTTKTRPDVVRECHFTPEPSCNDKIKNCHDGSCEVLIDCSGPCQPCPTCSDGIQNQGETDIDCGGPCPKFCLAEKPLMPKKPGKILYILLIIFLLVIALVVSQIISIRKMKEQINQEIKSQKKILTFNR